MHDDEVRTVSDYLRVGLAAMRAEKELLRAIVSNDKKSERAVRARYILLQFAVDKFRSTDEYAAAFGASSRSDVLQ